MFHKPPSDTPNGRFTHAEGLADLRIRPLALRTFEQDVSMFDLACRCLSLAREGLSCLLLLCCELNAMLFHGGLLLLIFSSLQGYLFFFLLSLEAGQSTSEVESAYIGENMGKPFTPFISSSIIDAYESASGADGEHNCEKERPFTNPSPPEREVFIL